MNSNVSTKDENLELSVEGQAEIENTMTLQRKLEDKLSLFFQNKEIMNERKEQNDIIKDEIRELFEKIGGQEVITELSNGTYARVIQRATIKEKLDKEALAQTLKVSADELKTPFDFSMFTSKGVLTPKMISEHTDSETKLNLSINRLKKKPKKKKEF